MTRYALLSALAVIIGLGGLSWWLQSRNAALAAVDSA